jgi:peptidyl-prolyl cis-trans isomerase D
VENDFKNERASVLLSQKTQELSDRAKASHDLKKAARELGASVKTSELVSQESHVPDIGAMSGQAAVVFAMKPGEISGPISTGASGAVLAVVDRQQPSPQDFAAKKDEVRDGLIQAKQGEIFAVFMADLRDRMQKSGKIKTNKNEMDKLAGGQPGGEGE